MIISGERVRQARELKSLTQSKLAALVGVSQAAIAQIETGAYIASNELIAEIARKTGQPVSFFYQAPSPEFDLGSLLFRSHASMTKRVMTEAYRHAQLWYEVAIRLQGRLRAMPVKIPKMPGADPIAAATECRRLFGLTDSGPIPHLLNVLEWHGVIAIAIPAGDSRDAFSLWHADRPILAISNGRSGDRSRLSVAHELGHLVLHAGKNRFEVEDSDADDFAAAFLMPEDSMRQEIRTPVTLASLAELKPRWRVSIQALIVRAKELAIITDRQYRYLFEQLSSLGWRKSEPVQLVEEKPRAIRQMAEMLYGDPIDYATMSNDFSIDRELIRHQLSFYAEKVKTEPPTGQTNLVSMSRRRRA